MTGRNVDTGNEMIEDVNLKKNRGLYTFRSTKENEFKLKKQLVHDFGALELFKDVVSLRKHSTFTHEATYKKF